MSMRSFPLLFLWLLLAPNLLTGCTGSGKSADAIAAALKSTDPSIRADAANTLAQMGPAAVDTAIVNDTHPEVTS